VDYLPDNSELRLERCENIIPWGSEDAGNVSRGGSIKGDPKLQIPAPRGGALRRILSDEWGSGGCRGPSASIGALAGAPSAEKEDLSG